MNRKLKTLGLAFFAAFAMSAVMASAASADEEFHSAIKNTVLDAENVGAGDQVFKITGGDEETTCENVGVNGTVGPETTKEITATPIYTDCHAGTGEDLVVDFNNCDYLFTSEETGSHAQVHIECAKEGEEIEIRVDTIFGEFQCIVVPPQTPTGGGVTYTNGTKEGKGDITVDATVTGITYTEIGVCDDGEPFHANDGTYEGEVTVSGTDNKGNFVNIRHE